MQKVSDKRIKEALLERGGIIASAASAVGLSREHLSRRISKSKMLQEARIEAREILLDMAEWELLKKVKAGNTRAIIFALSTLGRSRGYGNPRNVTFTHSYSNRIEPPKDEKEVLRAMREALGLPPEEEEQVCTTSTAKQIEAPKESKELEG